MRTWVTRNCVHVFGRVVRVGLVTLRTALFQQWTKTLNLRVRRVEKDGCTFLNDSREFSICIGVIATQIFASCIVMFALS